MPFRQLAAATNPAAPSHPLMRRFTPPPERREWITMAENQFLPPDDRERLASLGDGVHAERLALGLPVAGPEHDLVPARRSDPPTEPDDPGSGSDREN